MVDEQGLAMLIGVVAVGVVLLGVFGLDALEWLIDALASLLGGDDTGAQQPAGLHLTCKLNTGSAWDSMPRELAVYTLSTYGSPVHVRVDGGYVPPEELPEPAWVRLDAGLPRNWRGETKWDPYLTRPAPAERRREIALPLWAQDQLRVLRQEVDVCRRALERRNAVLKETKSRLRLLSRLLQRQGAYVLAGYIDKAKAGLWRGYDLMKPPLGEEPADDDATG